MALGHITSWVNMLAALAGRLASPAAPAQGVRVQMSSHAVHIEPLASHPDALPILQSWFESEWAEWYGPGGSGNAHEDLASYSNPDSLPFGVVAYSDGELCGTAALNFNALSGYEDLSPWVGATLVATEYRNRGIGALLVGALETAARRMGIVQIYSGTTQAHRLLLKLGWQAIGQSQHNGESISVYEKAL